MVVLSGLVKGVDKVGEIAEEDINIMMSTNVTGLINVSHQSSRFNKIRQINTRIR